MEMRTFWQVITQKQTTIKSAAIVLMTMVLASRVLGLVRDRLLAARFAPEELGIYFAAFRIPNLIFELLIMGALTAAFIPVYTKYITKNQQEDAWVMSSTLINIGFIFVLILSIPLLIWTESISSMIAPGFSTDEILKMAAFTRFMIVFQLVPLVIGNFFTGILQSHHLFFIPAAAPVVYNIGIIICVIAFSSTLGMWAPVVGVALGALFFMLIQIPPLISLGFRHRFILSLRHKGVIESVRLMIPRTIGLAVSQIDSTIDLILSTILGARMVTVFNFAQHLQQLPIGLFGATVAQAAFPLLSQATANSDEGQFKKTLVSAINQIMFFILPISVFFIVLRIPIVRLVFGASRFDWDATVLTSITLSTFSVSLFAQAVSQVLTRAYYARYDSKTPVIIGVITILVNAGLSILFVQQMRYPVWSLGISTSFASILNVTILYIFLCRKLRWIHSWDVIRTPLLLAIAAIITGVALYIPLKLFDQLVFDTTRTVGLLFLTGVTGFIGTAVYLFLVWVFGVTQAKSFIELLLKFRHPKSIFLEPATEVVGNGSQEAPMS